MAEWDLTPVLAKHLDPLLVMGLFEFIDNQGVSFRACLRQLVVN